MQFKITIITGVFFLLISALSIANPISQKEIPPQKTEQIQKQKPNFIQKIILKKMEKKIKRNGESALNLSLISFGLGFVSFVLGIFGALTALAAIIIGSIVLRKKEADKKSRILSIAGIALGAVFIIGALYLLKIILDGGFVLF